MKGKSLLLVAGICGLTTSALAQITTGTTTASTIKIGNRAQEGDYGLYLGATTDIVKDIFDSDVEVKGLPLLNFKYMYTDQIEYRVGLELWRTTEKMKYQYSKIVNEYHGSKKIKQLESRYFVYPGVAYHFSQSNLIDIYAGAELPLGFEHYRVKTEGAKYEETVSRGSFTLGLGTFIGMQAYIADLPLAIGVEYGLSSLFNCGNKYKYKIKDDKSSQTYYTENLGEDDIYSKLKVSKGDIGTQIRVTLTYYFKK